MCNGRVFEVYWLLGVSHFRFGNVGFRLVLVFRSVLLLFRQRRFRNVLFQLRLLRLFSLLLLSLSVLGVLLFSRDKKWSIVVAPERAMVVLVVVVVVVVMRCATNSCICTQRETFRTTRPPLVLNARRPRLLPFGAIAKSGRAASAYSIPESTKESPSRYSSFRFAHQLEDGKLSS